MWIVSKKLNTLFVCAFALFIHTASSKLIAQTATINAGTVYQTIDGFGSQTWSYADSMTNGQAAKFFSQTPGTGIGLSIVRSANTWDGEIPDLSTLQTAVAQGAQVELSMQSPPCGANLPAAYFPSPNNAPNVKASSIDNGESCSNTSDWNNQGPAFSDGSPSSNGTCFTASQSLDASFAVLATYDVNYIKMYAANGVPVTFFDVQNEPNLYGSPGSNNLGTCYWASGANFDNFVANYLGPALAAAGLKVKVMVSSNYNWFGEDWASTCLSDSNCAQYAAIASGHGYGFPYSPTAYTPGITNGKHTWMAETSQQCSGSCTYDSTMTTALQMAENMQAFLQTAKVSAYNWWNLAYLQASSNYGIVACPYVTGNGGCSNSGTDLYVYGKLFYAYGNWTLFVRPGQVEIAATQNPQSGVTVTAFENASTGAFEIVAVNSNNGSVSQSFSLNGLSASSLTPYITDPNNNLAQQSPLPITNNAFTATLTGSSVTTFVGAGGNSSAPTNLSGAIVQ